jgi:hypothetical protein
MASCGRCSSDSNTDPARVTALKLATRPAITRYGRILMERDGFAGADATDQDHRQHRQDARRYTGDESAEEADSEQCEHVGY